MKKIYLLFLFPALLVLQSSAQSFSIEKDSTDFGYMYTDTAVGVYVFVTKKDMEVDQQVIALTDLFLENEDWIDSTSYLIQVAIHGEVQPEVYALTQNKFEQYGYKYVMPVMFDVGTRVDVNKITFFPAFGSITHRWRIVNVIVDVAME